MYRKSLRTANHGCRPHALCMAYNRKTRKLRHKKAVMTEKKNSPTPVSSIRPMPVPAPCAQRENDPLTETTTGTELIYENRFLRLVRESVTLPGGEQGNRFILPHRGACAMIPLDEQGCIVLERQWRHPLRRAFWEIPAGKIDPDESELVCAQRELIEECGIRARQWTELGVINNAIGYSDEHITIFLDEDLSIGEQHLDPGEYLELYRVPFEEALAMCYDGRITDVKTLCGIFWLAKVLSDRRSAAADGKTC